MQIIVLIEDVFDAAFALREPVGKGYLVPEWNTLAELAEMARTGPRADLIPVTVTEYPKEAGYIVLECDQEAWKNA